VSESLRMCSLAFVSTASLLACLWVYESSLANEVKGTLGPVENSAGRMTIGEIQE
jgi:hypothetical protein